MSEASSTPMGFMNIPRELRDQIYDQVLTAKYPATSSPAMRRLADSPVRSSWDSDADWETILRRLRLQVSEGGTVQPASDRLGILQTSSTISQEALQILYKKSTFIFVTAPPSDAYAFDPMRVKAIKSMRNIEIYCPRDAIWDPIVDDRLPPKTTSSVPRLLWSVSGSVQRKESCTVRLKNRGLYDYRAYLLHAVLPALLVLKHFKRVVLKLFCCNNTEECILRRYHHVPPCRDLDEVLIHAFGSSTQEMDADGYHVLTYHTQSYNAKKLSKSSAQGFIVGTDRNTLDHPLFENCPFLLAPMAFEDHQLRARAGSPNIWSSSFTI